MPKFRLRVIAMMLIAASMTMGAFAQEDGATTYKGKCAMCHGADGLADTPAGKAMKAPSFKSPDVVKASDADLIAAVKNGKGKMPSYSGKITDGQITQVVAYIRTLQKK